MMSEEIESSNVSDHDDYSIQTLLHHLSASVGMLTPKSFSSRIPIETESELDNDEQGDLRVSTNDLFDIFSEDFIQHLDAKMKRLEHIWSQMDLDIEEQQAKIKALKDKLVETVDSFVEAEHESCRSYEERIASLEQQIAMKLEQMIRYMAEKELCEIFKASSMKQSNSKIEQLEQIVETLNDHQSRHLEEVNRLQNHLKTLMEKLGLNGMEVENLLTDKSMTFTELEKLCQETVQCESELGKRKNDCDQIVKMIGFMVESIPWELNNQFCSENLHILDGNYCLIEDFIYSDSNLKILNNHYENLIKQFQYHLEMIRQKFDQLQQICKLLDLEQPNIIHSNHLMAFLIEQQKVKNLEDTLETFNQNRYKFEDTNLQQLLYELATEYEYCEQMKSERLETIIGNLRKQYFEQLEKCLADVDLLLADPKFQFLLDNTNYDTDLLELHEKELKKLQAYYEKYEEFFTLSSKRIELEEKMAQAERKSTEIYKLKNRGGIMLKFVNEKRNNKRQLSLIKQQLQTWFQDKMLNSNSDNYDELSLGFYRLNLQCENILCQLQETFGECKFALSLKNDQDENPLSDIQSNDET